MQCQSGLPYKMPLPSTASGNPTPANARPGDPSFRVYIIQESKAPCTAGNLAFVSPIYRQSWSREETLQEEKNK